MPRLLGAFSRSMLSSSAQLGLGIVNTVLMMRLLGLEVTGQYLLLMAVFSSAPTLLNALDQAITRFGSELDSPELKHLAGAVLVVKLQSSLLLICLAAAATHIPSIASAIEPFLYPSHWALLFACWLSFWLLPMLANWVNRVIAAGEDYLFPTLSDFLTSACCTAWLTVALLLLDIRNLDKVMVGFTTVSAVFLALKLWYLHRQNRELLLQALHSAFDLSPWKTLFIKRYRQYFLPFTVTAASGLMKDLIPLLVVGSVANAQSVAEFRVVQLIFRVTHSIVPNAFELIRPSLVRMRSNSEQVPQFNRQYRRYSHIYLFASTAFALITGAALTPILALWGVTSSELIVLVAMVMSLELLFGVATHIEYQVFLLQDKTTYLVWMSVTRQVVTALVMAYCGSSFGLIGVAAGPAAGALITWFGFAAYAKATSLRPNRDLLTSFFHTTSYCTVCVAAYLFVFRP